MPRRAVLFVCFTCAYFLSYFFRSANAVIAGDLTREFSLTAGQLGLMSSLFFAGFAAVQLPLGAALDRLGPRIVTPAVLMLAVAGSLVFAGATSFGALAAGRTLIGAGMACVLMGTIKAFGAWFPPTRVATISGVTVGIGAMGGLLAATPLAWLNESVGWRAIFAWGALVILLSAGSIALWTRSAPAREGGRGASADGRAASGFGLVFGDMRFWRIAPLNFFLIGSYLAVQTLWGGPYLFDVLGMSQIAAGNALLALGLGVVAGYFICGWLGDRYGVPRVMAWGVGVFLLSLAPLALPGFRPPVPLLYVSLAAFGFTGAFNLLLLAQIRAIVPAHVSGRAITACNLFGFAGTALIQGAMGLIIGAFPPDAAGRYPHAAYTAAFLFIFAGSALALAWYLPLVAPQIRRPLASPANE